ncbi:hypothetical protein DSUL_150059 [Desulfovibrionales bacterium]
MWGGGTHTDAVILDRGEVVATSKATTDHENLIISVRTALDNILIGVDSASINRCNLSTTISTNAIVENRTEDVGMIVSAGPGIDPGNFRIGRGYFVISGALDHRGNEIRSLDIRELETAVICSRELGLRVFCCGNQVLYS